MSTYQAQDMNSAENGGTVALEMLVLFSILYIKPMKLLQMGPMSSTPTC